MARDPLESPKLKIERAKSLISEVNAKITRYLDTVPTNMLVAPHPADKEQKIAVAKIDDPVPTEIALVVGDAIHNLRTALDHLACSLSVANGKSRNGVSFPFAQNLADFRKTAPDKIRKLTPAARKLIHRLKPYGGGCDLLYMLSKLDNRDKHQTLFLCASYLGRWSGEFSCDHPIQVNREPFGSLNKGVHIFTFPTKAKFEQKLTVSFTLAFADVEGTEGRPISTILGQFTKLVERILKIFERRFFPIDC